ncbi:MAG: Asp-tRNA(Asn)/Glu-tRNA(Gln) amidotransferase subunit GatC [Candidatus Omnitrophica bacterium]|jgi:aspartyl-tRNA(Asn)/glutamyl-tRNA(Gln) amidotransferase subunit C|nr:Asp-tRNA(Asn)/Glu-tRNA(Gln) amidotransferase subunit GatC [Candidatus Omnitrophota bacterium]
MPDKKQVEYVANLARIGINPGETEYLSSQLSKILDYIDKLKELNVDNVEPMRGLNLANNIFRKDEVVDSAVCEDILKNSPSREGNYFKIPKVIE